MDQIDTSTGLLFIDGEFREASDGGRFLVISPYDESIVGWAAEATLTDVASAVGAARQAFDRSSWSTDTELRKRCLVQLQDALRRYAPIFKDLLTSEAGSLARGLGAQINGPIEEMSYEIDLIDSFEWELAFPAYVRGDMRSLRHVRYEPYGVVGAITPWNAPFMLNIWKTVPALATGNTVVLKTAPDTPLIGALLAKVIDEDTDIPDGVFNVISSSDNAVGGDGLTRDPGVDMFHFTGSSTVGMRIAQNAAIGVRKVVLELGGKSANIVLDDADLDVAIPHSVFLCMTSSGQGCNLPTRMIVHESLYDEVVERVTSAVTAIPWGDPRDPQSFVGPIIRSSQVDRIEGLVDRARTEGGRVVVGGHRGDHGGKGFWYVPTAVIDVDENSELAQTEVFGPVLSVSQYSGDDDEAVRMANNSKYGLAAYVQTRDIGRASAIAKRIHAGTVNIAKSFSTSPDTPFGGYGLSGLGREHGVDGWKEFLQSKTISTPA